jgi:hypothetical protein
MPIIHNTLGISQAIIFPHRIRRRQKAISRERAKGESSRRDGRTEHTIEKENPKHSPIQNVMTSKRAAQGTPKVLCT